MTEVASGPSRIPDEDLGLYSRLRDNIAASDARDDEDNDLSDSELFDELERELEEEEARGGTAGRLREDRMEELKRQYVLPAILFVYLVIDHVCFAE